jgi:beta-phosphoglucomutase-like phosphatase (HAD superfamily)
MKLPRPPAAVIFDMDGLLFDTERLYGQAILTAATEVGCPMSHDIFLRLIGGSREGNHAFLISHYGPDYPLATLIATWGRHFRELAVAGLPLKPGATELLDLLDDLGLPRAIATSSTHATVQANLLAHSLTDRSTAWWRTATMPAASPRPIPISRRPNGWAWRPYFAWRLRIPTAACDRPRRPA